LAAPLFGNFWVEPRKEILFPFLVGVRKERREGRGEERRGEERRGLREEGEAHRNPLRRMERREGGEAYSNLLRGLREGKKDGVIPDSLRRIEGREEGGGSIPRYVKEDRGKGRRRGRHTAIRFTTTVIFVLQSRLRTFG
jgi:hypothetical protein